MADQRFDPTPARRTFGQALDTMRGKSTPHEVPLAVVARNLPNARGGQGIQRQALMELSGLTCPTCKGSGHQGEEFCDTCGGSGVVYKANPTLERIEQIAGALGVVAELTFIYPPGHPLDGQVVTGIAPGLEPLVAKGEPEQ